jgi:hypothetical protein
MSWCFYHLFWGICWPSLTLARTTSITGPWLIYVPFDLNTSSSYMVISWTLSSFLPLTLDSGISSLAQSLFHVHLSVTIESPHLRLHDFPFFTHLLSQSTESLSYCYILSLDSICSFSSYNSLHSYLANTKSLEKSNCQSFTPEFCLENSFTKCTDAKEALMGSDGSSV